MIARATGAHGSTWNPPAAQNRPSGVSCSTHTGLPQRRGVTVTRRYNLKVRRFAALYDEIDSTTSTNAKVAAMARYFAEAPRADAAWAVFFLTGRRLKRLVPHASIAHWTMTATGIEDWLLGECYSVV